VLYGIWRRLKTGSRAASRLLSPNLARVPLDPMSGSAGGDP
jgi:hypothetical protein